MKEPVVSVLMPVYNGQSFIANAIKSILSQTFNAFEFIIVDDGSSDGTSQIIASFQDERIRLISQKHHGIAKSLNNGLSVCKGKYIARMDSDDVSHSERLQRQVEYLSVNENIGAISCKVKYDSFEDLPKGYKEYVNWTNQLIGVEDIAKNRFVESPLAHPSIMFRRSLIDKYGPYTTEDIPEDYELWLRWLHNNVSIGKLNLELLIWNDRSSRLSRIDPQYSEEAFYRLKASYFSKWYKIHGDGKAIFIWGKGKVMKRRLNFLIKKELPIEGFIDIVINPKSEFIYYKDIESYAGGIVLGFVSDKKGKAEISAFLDQNSYKEGIDFFHYV